MSQIKAEASPTKESFIDVLVRDVTIEEAISELIDNAVDGAKRVAADKGHYKGLYVHIKYSDVNFSIEDNCGGISAELARDYAFRFGRSSDFPTDLQPKLGIGQFGIGMKRALFMLGEEFEVTSTTEDSHFALPVKVETWLAAKTNTGEELWQFEFSDFNPKSIKKFKNLGTTIRVSKLKPNVAKRFASGKFKIGLVRHVEAEQAEALIKGLEITINGSPLIGRRDEIIFSDKIKPFVWKKKYAKGKLQVMIFAGVSKVSLNDYGWYVYCNDRQVLRADRTSMTGWREEFENPNNPEEMLSIPKAHSQYSRFRGYVFFESDDVSLLPWNTKKSGINENSEVYQAVKLEMMVGMRPIVDFLNNVDRETDLEQRPLTEMLTEAEQTDVVRVANIISSKASRFIAPSGNGKSVPPPKLQRISYQRPLDEIRQAKRLANVDTNEEVGITTFEYFLKMQKKR